MSIDREMIKKMWCIYPMEYQSALYKNEIMPFAAIQMCIKIVILSEGNQKEKDKYHDIGYMWNLKGYK